MFPRVLPRYGAIRLTSRSSLTTTLVTTPQRSAISTAHSLGAYATISARDWLCLRGSRHSYGKKEGSLSGQSNRSITTSNSANLPARKFLD